MAESAAAKKTDEEQPAPSAEKKSTGGESPKPILLIIVVVLNMLVMASVFGILYTSYKAEKAKPKLQDVVQGEKDDQAKSATEEHEDLIGKLVPMETFLVNLAGTRGNKLVKINMELEVDGPKVEEEIDKRKPQIRDIIIILLSSKTYDQVSVREGKEKLREEVRDTVNSFLVKGQIKKVYFTDFIVN